MFDKENPNSVLFGFTQESTTALPRQIIWKRLNLKKKGNKVE